MVTVTKFIEESGRGSRRKWAGQRYENSGPFHSSVIFVVSVKASLVTSQSGTRIHNLHVYGNDTVVGQSDA